MLVNAENIEVTSFKYAGPYTLMQPYQIDSVDVNSKPWKAESLLDTPVSFALLDGAEVKQAGQLTPSPCTSWASCWRTRTTARCR